MFLFGNINRDWQKEEMESDDSVTDDGGYYVISFLAFIIIIALSIWIGYLLPF